MKAYAILDGGGVKGSALAGCLKGAHTSNIEFVGYGGTSAGSIVALLASIGYTPDELLALMCDELNFDELLDDGGASLPAWERLIQKFDAFGTVMGKATIVGGILSMQGEIGRLTKERGLYSGDKFQLKLRQFIVRKFRFLENKPEITFADLESAGAKPLRIVAANLMTRRGVIMGNVPNSPISDVPTAVRASCSFPFLFRPVMLHKAAFADGGLASNLPVWLFDDERGRTGYPVIAFDLTSKLADAEVAEQKFGGFLSDMLETVLESGDALIRNGQHRLMHIEVPIGSDVRTLDFSLSPARRRDLYNEGQRVALDFFVKRFVNLKVLADPAAQLEVTYGDKTVFVTALEGMLREIATEYPTSGMLRASVMLPFEDGERLTVVYRVGMDADPDADLTLTRGAGPTGMAVQYESPIFLDWKTIRAKPHEFGMTLNEINKVPKERSAVVCVPVFDLRRAPVLEDGVMGGLSLIGALSLDSDVSGVEAGWLAGDESSSQDGKIVTMLKRWADVIGRLLN